MAQALRIQTSTAGCMTGHSALKASNRPGKTNIGAAISRTGYAACKRGASLMVNVSSRGYETPDEALARRLRESAQVEERVVDVHGYDDFQRKLAEANGQLVVLEVQSDHVCQTGLVEEAEVHWKDERALQMQPCRQIKHVFQRTARACTDVVFLEALADTPEGEELCDKLGISVLPTLQFWKDGRMMWEHKGSVQMEQGVGEGVLFYGDVAAGGVHASDFVAELRNPVEFEEFVAKQPENLLTVVYVGISAAAPCISIYPAVLALAKNFVGYASFARVIGDDTPELQHLMGQLNIVQVPTFIFYRNGAEVGRHVGGTRADLIGQILRQQSLAGQAVPQPPSRGVRSRR